MKRICILACILIVCISLVACSSNYKPDSNVEEKPQPTENTAQTPEVIEAINDWADVPTFEYLVNKYENIVIAQIVEKLPSVSMTNKELGITESTQERIFTSFNIEVIESLKGIFSPGDIVRLEQDGGTVGNKTFVIRDDPLLKQGSTYLIFIYEPKSRNDGEYFNYVVPDPLDGRVEIKNGIIIPHKWSRFYKEGMSIEEIKEWIEQAVQKE